MTLKYLMSNETLFRDIDIFEIHYTPETIKYRDLRMRQLAEIVRPAILGGRPFFASFTNTTPISYTAFYHRLNKLADLRLIDLIPGSVKGNIHEVVLKYAPLKVIELLSNVT